MEDCWKAMTLRSVKNNDADCASRSRNPFNRLLQQAESNVRRLFSHVGVVLCCRPAGLYEVDRTLKARGGFVPERWQHLDVPIPLVLDILKVVQEGAGWPNAAFTPGDHVAVLMYCSSNDFAFDETILLLKRRFGFDYVDSKLDHVFADELTIGEFVSQCALLINWCGFRKF